MQQHKIQYNLNPTYTSRSYKFYSKILFAFTAILLISALCHAGAFFRLYFKNYSELKRHKIEYDLLQKEESKINYNYKKASLVQHYKKQQSIINHRNNFLFTVLKEISIALSGLCKYQSIKYDSSKFVIKYSVVNIDSFKEKMLFLEEKYNFNYVLHGAFSKSQDLVYKMVLSKENDD